MNLGQKKLKPCIRPNFYKQNDIYQTNKIDLNQRYVNTDTNICLNEKFYTPQRKSYDQIKNINDIRDFIHPQNKLINSNLEKENQLLKQDLENKKLKRDLINQRIKLDIFQMQESNKKIDEDEEERRNKMKDLLDKRILDKQKRNDDLKMKLDLTNRILEQFTKKEENKKKLTKEIKQNLPEIKDIYKSIEKYADYSVIESNHKNIKLRQNTNNVNQNNEFLKNVLQEVDVHRQSLNFLKEKEDTMINEIKTFCDNIKEIKTNFQNLFEEEIKNFEENKNKLSDQIAYRAQKMNEVDDNKFDQTTKENLMKSKNLMRKEFENSINNLNNSQSEYLKLMKKIFDNTNKFFNDISSLSALVNPLNNNLENAFTMFNKIHDKYFSNGNGKTENLQEGLQSLKENLNTLVKKIYGELKTITEKSQKILKKDIFSVNNQKELENSQKKINDKNEEINNVMNDQLNKINNIRSSYNYETVNKPENEELIQTNIIKGNENLSKIEEKSKGVSTEIKKNVQSIKQEVVHIRKKFILDLLLIIDTTISMMPYVNEVQMKILEIVKGIKNKFPNIDVRLGFIGYTDIIDPKIDPIKDYINLELTTNHRKIRNAIQKIKVQGGGDDAEDLAGALELALKKEWLGNARYAIVVTDAPCHGRKYHNGTNEKYDCYMDGYKDTGIKREDPCELFKKFLKNHISLLCLEIQKKHTEKMFEEFRDIYNDAKLNDFGCEFKVEDNKDKDVVRNMVDVIINNTIEIFERNRDKYDYYDNSNNNDNNDNNNNSNNESTIIHDNNDLKLIKKLNELLGDQSESNDDDNLSSTDYKEVDNEKF